MEKFEKLEKEPFKEKEIFDANLRVDFIRHGERTEPLKDELSDKGRKTIEQTAKELSQEVNKEKELLVFWVSPKRRCQQTAEIIKEHFKKEDISFIEPRTKNSLTSIKYTEEGAKKFIQQMGEVSKWIDEWMEHWAIKELPEGLEKPEEMEERVKRILTYLERTARDVHPAEGRKLHFLCILHEELFRDLLEEGYNLGTKKGTRPTFGEKLRIDIHKSEPGKNAIFDLTYRNSKANLEFNKETREFRRINSNL